MNKTKCPACEKVQSIKVKNETTVSVTCKKCKTLFTASKMGNKYPI